MESKLTDAVTRRLIDEDDEKLVPLDAAFQKVIGEHFNYSTFWRWGTRGVLVNGKRVYLETTKIGRRRRTTVSAVRRFIDAMNPAASHPDAERQATTDAKLRERGLLDRPRKGRKSAPNTAG